MDWLTDRRGRSKLLFHNDICKPIFTTFPEFNLLPTDLKYLILSYDRDFYERGRFVNRTIYERSRRPFYEEFNKLSISRSEILDYLKESKEFGLFDKRTKNYNNYRYHRYLTGSRNIYIHLDMTQPSLRVIELDYNKKIEEELYWQPLELDPMTQFKIWSRRKSLLKVNPNYPLDNLRLVIKDLTLIDPSKLKNWTSSDILKPPFINKLFLNLYIILTHFGSHNDLKKIVGDYSIEDLGLAISLYRSSYTMMINNLKKLLT